jgi:hypothetical protein
LEAQLKEADERELKAQQQHQQALEKEEKMRQEKEVFCLSLSYLKRVLKTHIPNSRERHRQRERERERRRGRVSENKNENDR